MQKMDPVLLCRFSGNRAYYIIVPRGMQVAIGRISGEFGPDSRFSDGNGSRRLTNGPSLGYSFMCFRPAFSPPHIRAFPFSRRICRSAAAFRFIDGSSAAIVPVFTKKGVPAFYETVHRRAAE